MDEEERITVAYHEKILASDHYELWAGDVASIEVTRIAEHRDTLKCEIEVRWHGPVPGPGLLHHGTLNVLAARSVTSVANDCRERIDLIDWAAYLKWATHRIKTIWREGDQPIRLANAGELVGSEILENFVSADGPTIFIGAPGTTKSVLGAGIALAVATGDSRILRIQPKQTGPVLYLDWELSPEMHKHRMAAMCRHHKIDIPDTIHYRREYASLDSSAEFLRKYIVRHGIVLAIVDSVGKARGSDPNDGLSAIRFWQAVDSLRVPVVAIDHLSREAIKKDQARGMGSIYNDAYVRLAWRLDAWQDGKQTTVSATNWKNNFGLNYPKRSWKVVFDGEGQRISEMWFEEADASTVLNMAWPTNTQPTTVDQVHEALASSSLPMTISALAEFTSLAEDTIGKTLRRSPERFANTGTRSKGLWALKGRDQLEAPF